MTPPEPLSRPAPRTPAGLRYRVLGWDDPRVDRLGLSTGSAYFTWFWGPLLGPTATLFVVRVGELLAHRPDGLEVDFDVMAPWLGLGSPTGLHAPFPRAVRRAVRYGMAKPVGDQALAVRRFVAPVPVALRRRVPAPVLACHDVVLARSARRVAGAPRRAATGAGSSVHPRARARLVALEAALGGVADDALEAALHARGVHPALASDAAAWLASAGGAGAREAVGARCAPAPAQR